MSPTARAWSCASTTAGLSGRRGSSTSRTPRPTSWASSAPARRRSRSRASFPANAPAYNSAPSGKRYAQVPRLSVVPIPGHDPRGGTAAALGHRQVLDRGRSHERPGSRRAECRRAIRAGITHQADDRVPCVRRAARQEAHARPAGERVDARLEGGRLAHVHRTAQAGDGRRADPRHGGAVGQRCLHRARRSRGRQRGSLRADDEPRGGAPRDEEHEVHERRRPARRAALPHRAGPLSPCCRVDPRLSERVRAVLLAEGIPLQQHHAAEPQPAAVDRSQRRRREDRTYRGRGFLPDRLFAPRRPAASLRVARLHLGCHPRAGIAQAPQLGLPVLRQRQAVPGRHAGEVARGVEGRGAHGQSRRRQRSFCHGAEGRSRQAQSRARVATAARGAAHEGTARRRRAGDARRQGVRRVPADRARAGGASGVLRPHLGYTAVMAEINTVFLNGRLLPLEQANVSVLDRGFIFGDGVYELVPVYSRVAFRLDEHLARLERSLGEAKIRNPYLRSQWRAHIHQLIDAQSFEDQGVYFQVTRGAAKRDHAFPKAIEPTVFMMSNPLVNPPAEAVEKGASEVSAVDNRWLRCDIQSTPKTNLILPGITYDVIVELALANSLAIEFGELTEAQVRAADEIWVTSSSKEVLAIVELDGKRVGNGRPGPVFRRMFQLYQEFKQKVMRAGKREVASV